MRKNMLMLIFVRRAKPREMNLVQGKKTDSKIGYNSQDLRMPRHTRCDATEKITSQ